MSLRHSASLRHTVNELTDAALVITGRADIELTQHLPVDRDVVVARSVATAGIIVWNTHNLQRCAVVVRQPGHGGGWLSGVVVEKLNHGADIKNHVATK